MYNTIKRLYAKTNDKTVVARAVEKGWITEADYESIVGETYKQEE